MRFQSSMFSDRSYESVKFTYYCSDEIRRFFFLEEHGRFLHPSFPSETIFLDCLKQDPQNPKRWGINLKIVVGWSSLTYTSLTGVETKIPIGSNWWEFQLQILDVQFLKAVGEACTDSSDCESADCASGKCSVLKAVGEACTVSSECESALWCASGKCGVLTVGEACTVSSECKSADCASGKCGFLNAVGEACTVSSECESADCFREMRFWRFSKRFVRCMHY